MKKKSKINLTGVGKFITEKWWLLLLLGVVIVVYLFLQKMYGLSIKKAIMKKEAELGSEDQEIEVGKEAIETFVAEQTGGKAIIPNYSIRNGTVTPGSTEGKVKVKIPGGIDLVKRLAAALDYPGHYFRSVDTSEIIRVAGQLTMAQMPAFEALFNAWAVNDQELKDYGFTNPSLADAFSRANANIAFWVGDSAKDYFLKHLKDSPYRQTKEGRKQISMIRDFGFTNPNETIFWELA